MDFQLTDEQSLLRNTTRDLLARSYDTETRNRVLDTDDGFSRDVWKQLADTGILGLGFDEDTGGQIEVAVVCTEIGRRLAPEPVLTAALGPGALIAEQGTPEQRGVLDAVASGETLLAFAHHEPADAGTAAQQHGDGWQLTGRKNPVLAGHCADTFIVSAALPDGGTGLFLVDADAAGRRAYRTFDGLHGAQLDLDATPAEPLGAAADATAAITAATVRMHSALCAEAVGAMEEALRLTTEYLTTRKQFGVTLNKFQTLTQRAADMYVSLELARSMNLYAAMSIADGTVDPVVAARAGLQIIRSGRHIAEEAIQLHGGIGMTAEYPVGHYAARLTAIDQTLGSSAAQVRVLAGQLGDYEVAAL